LGAISGVRPSRPSRALNAAPLLAPKAGSGTAIRFAARSAASKASTVRRSGGLGAVGDADADTIRPDQGRRTGDHRAVVLERVERGGRDDEGVGRRAGGQFLA